MNEAATGNYRKAYYRKTKKTVEKLLKENYRPVRILSILSKVFEKSMSKFLNIFLKYQYHGCLLNKAKSANKQFIQ